MKKGDYVKITDSAKYRGQDMRWTETCTGRKVLPAGTVLFHYSDKKINEFLEKETCFFDDDRSYGHCYIAILTKPVKVAEYSTEVRFWIDETNCKIQYLGTRKYIRTGKRVEVGYDEWYERIIYKDEIICKENLIKKELWGK